jgi:RNA polymerase sigma factor (sigma-70 family)
MLMNLIPVGEFYCHAFALYIIVKYIKMNVSEYQKSLAKIPAEELFLIMSMKVENPEQASLAYGEFYTRYHKFLEKIIKSICAYYEVHAAEIEEVLMSNTLLLVYEKAELFVKIEVETTSFHKDNRIKAWLGKMAQTELLKIIRKGENDCLTIDRVEDEESDIFSFEDTPMEEQTESEEDKILEAAFLLLTETERLVVRQIYLHKQPGKNLPATVLDFLSKELGVKRDSIRQIHKRALQKIKNHLILKTQSYEHIERHHNNERRNL